MTTATLIMTKLDAVNEMLASIGQAPINTLSGSIPPDAARAVIALDTQTRAVLTKGWSFNSDYEYVLSPDVSNNILVPTTALWIDPAYTTKDYVQRWDSGVAKLYDVENQTFAIEDDVKADIVWAFDFESIPQAARYYITTRAGRIFQTQIVGSRILFEYTAQIEAEAWDTFKQTEKKSKDYNFINNSYAANRQWRAPRYR